MSVQRSARPSGAVSRSGERADLLIRLAEVLGVLDYAETVELALLAEALARKHGLATGKDPTR
jgi:hypothetical protein